MIPFPQYLTPTGQQIVEYVSKAHFKIQQNGSYCSNKNLFGSAIPDTKTFLICTKISSIILNPLKELKKPSIMKQFM